ncbi:MAG: hypothetical protein ABW318_14535 [Vicinamibacterales bacterium]
MRRSGWNEQHVAGLDPGDFAGDFVLQVAFEDIDDLWSAISRAASASAPAAAGRLWHDERMLQLVRALVGVALDILRLVVSFLPSSRAIRTENVVLRKQLASYIERRIKPRRLDHATRVGLALFTCPPQKLDHRIADGYDNARRGMM